MKNISFKILLICILSTASLFLKGQNSDLSIGLRFGSYNGFSARMDFEEPVSMEFILGGRENGLTATILLQLNRPIDLFWSRGFSWYYGIGTHFGYLKTDDERFFYEREKLNQQNLYQSVALAGIDGCVGLLYRFPEIPVEISLGFKPHLEIVNVKRFRMKVFDSAMTIRYRINNN